jgi:hypothetical protein
MKDALGTVPKESKHHISVAWPDPELVTLVRYRYFFKISVNVLLMLYFVHRRHFLLRNILGRIRKNVNCRIRTRNNLDVRIRIRND